MSDFDEAMELKRLADAIDNFNAVKGFIAAYGDQIPGSLSLSWSAAGACPGYDETRRQVLDVVRHWWPTIAANAVNAAESRLIDARKKFADAAARGAE